MFFGIDALRLEYEWEFRKHVVQFLFFRPHVPLGHAARTLALTSAVSSPAISGILSSSRISGKDPRLGIDRRSSDAARLGVILHGRLPRRLTLRLETLQRLRRVNGGVMSA